MRTLCLLIFLCIQAKDVVGQMTIRIDSVPSYYTPWMDTLYITGDFNNWDPADPAYQLQKQSDGSYLISMPVPSSSQIQYKYTRGDWSKVETQASGAFLPNRVQTYVPGQTITDQIYNWDDMIGLHTAVGNTYMLTEDFYIPQFNRNRRVWIYLPDSYFSSTDSFPVIYMHDGQNLFDAMYSFSGEWGIDESMAVLQIEGQQPAIIVGIDNGGVHRIDEYTPWSNPTYGGGSGALYIDFIIQTLKPFIDANFRTKSNRENTCLFGSSLGGLISFYGAIRYQDHFSKVGVFSPSFWFSDQIYSYVSNVGKTHDMRFYFYAGAQESSNMTTNMLRMIDTLSIEGFMANEMQSYIHPSGTHAESYWRLAFPDAYRWLFAQDTTVTTIKNFPQDDLPMYYANGVLNLKPRFQGNEDVHHYIQQGWTMCITEIEWQPI